MMYAPSNKSYRSIGLRCNRESICKVLWLEVCVRPSYRLERRKMRGKNRREKGMNEKKIMKKKRGGEGRSGEEKKGGRGVKWKKKKGRDGDERKKNLEASGEWRERKVDEIYRQRNIVVYDEGLIVTLVQF